MVDKQELERRLVQADLGMLDQILGALEQIRTGNPDYPGGTEMDIKDVEQQIEEIQRHLEEEVQ